MDRIVVGVDGSPAATAAARWAACEAARRNVELTIVHVLQSAPEVWLQQGLVRWRSSSKARWKDR